jgi:hypothetical protein
MAVEARGRRQPQTGASRTRPSDLPVARVGQATSNGRPSGTTGETPEGEPRGPVPTGAQVARRSRAHALEKTPPPRSDAGRIGLCSSRIASAGTSHRRRSSPWQRRRQRRCRAADSLGRDQWRGGAPGCGRWICTEASGWGPASRTVRALCLLPDGAVISSLAADSRPLAVPRAADTNGDPRPVAALHGRRTPSLRLSSSIPPRHS